MRADRGSAQIGTAQPLLHRANVITRLQRMRGEYMAQHKRADWFFICTKPGKIHTEHLLAQIQKCRLGPILGRDRNLPVHSQVHQKCLHFSAAHILRVVLAVNPLFQVIDPAL